MSLNLALILRESAKKNPDHTAVIFESFKFSYGQLDALSSQVASSLKAAGLRQGDRVGLMVPNVPQFPMAYFGILKAGGVVVPMNVLLRAPEVSFYMGDSEARFLIVWEDFAGEALKGIENLKGITTYVALKPGSTAPPSGTKSFTELMAGIRSSTWSRPQETTRPSSSTRREPQASRRARRSRTPTCS